MFYFRKAKDYFFKSKKNWNKMKEKIYLIFGLVILLFALPFQSAFSQRQKSFVCVKTIKSSQSRIHSAEFSPDGKYILSVAEDRMIKTRNYFI